MPLSVSAVCIPDLDATIFFFACGALDCDEDLLSRQYWKLGRWFDVKLFRVSP